VRINEAYELLNSAYIDWSPILVNPRGIRKGSQITWDKYSSQVLKLPIRISDVIDMYNRGQYTFQVANDGSLIQIYYQFDTRGRELKSASLAFYSAVEYILSSDEDEDIVEVADTFQPETRVGLNDLDILDNILEEEYIVEPSDESQLISFRDGPISWVRIDYDPEHARGVLHHGCHMHFSAFPRARLVIDGIPNPKQFIEFIIALCYPGIYAKHRLDDDGQYINEAHIFAVNSNCVSLQEDNIYRQISHLRIPNISQSRRR
jgi:hypothetical protein